MPTSCQKRGYCRIPALQFTCIECGREFATCEAVIANEREKIRLTIGEPKEKKNAAD